MATRQDRVELKGSERAAMPVGQDVGPADPNQQIEVTVYLQHEGGKSPSAELIGSRPISERHYLTREEYANRMARVQRTLKECAPSPLNLACRSRAKIAPPVA
jgi:hypothetical protein